MSGYWDAVGRAALGLPGRADPGPRAMFSPDERREEGFEIVDEEFEIAPSLNSPMPGGRQIPTPQLSAAEPVSQTTVAASPVPVADPAPQASPQAHDSQMGDAQGAIETAKVTPVPPAVPAAQVVREAAIEVQRVERRQVVLETVAEPLRPSTDRPAATEPWRGGPAQPALPAEQATAISVESQPVHAVAAEPRPAPEPEPPHSSPAAEAPAPLVIEIDRIEVRIVSESVRPPEHRRRETAAAPTLDDYLARRSGAGR